MGKNLVGISVTEKVVTFFVKMKVCLVFLFLGVVACSQSSSKAMPTQCFVAFTECNIGAKTFMERVACVKGLEKCVKEKCKVPPVCLSNHEKCREEAPGFIDYLYCNVKFVKCLYKNREDICVNNMTGPMQ